MSRKILVQVSAPAVIVGLLLLLATLISAWYVQDLETNLNKILKQNVSSMRAAQQLEISVRALRFNCFRYLIGPTPDIAEKIARDEERFHHWLKVARDTANSPREIELVNRIQQGIEQYEKEFDALKTQASADGPRRDFDALVNANPVDRVIEPCRAYLEENDRSMNVTAGESDRVVDTLHMVLLLLGLVAPLAGIVSGYGIARTLSRSIHRLSVQVQDMAQQLDHPVGSVRLVAEGDIGKLDHQLHHVMRRVEEVTSRVQRQQRELLRAQQLSAVGHLAAGVAHEIRNPLTAVKMLVGLALRQHNRKDLTEADLQVIHDEVDRVEKTVQNLLDFARLPSPRRERCDLRDVVSHAMELVRGRAAQQKVTLTTQRSAEPVDANVDRGQLGTVLVNLLLNSLDAMPEGGTIEIAAKAVPDGVELEVIDTGRGIATDMMDRLFTPFSSDKPTGTGLGLSLSRRIVEEHGGTIQAANLGQGGASFRIVLPAAATESQHALATHHR